MVKKDNKQSFWGRILSALSSPTVKNYLVSFLQKNAIKYALKKLAIVGGFKAWLISFVIEELIEEADEHLIEPAFRKIGYLGDVADGDKIYRKVKNAQDRDDWRDSIGDV